MADAENPMTRELLEHTTEIVAAHVANNPVPVNDLPELIRQVYTTLAQVDTANAPQAEKPQPAVPIKRSVTPDYLICLNLMKPILVIGFCQNIGDLVLPPKRLGPF